jgi:hypothetical protein
MVAGMASIGGAGALPPLAAFVWCGSRRCSPASSIDSTITRLKQILEVAVEYGHVERNVAPGKRRRLKAGAPVRPTLAHVPTLTLGLYAKAVRNGRKMGALAAQARGARRSGRGANRAGTVGL